MKKWLIFPHGSRTDLTPGTNSMSNVDRAGEQTLDQMVKS